MTFLTDPLTPTLSPSGGEGVDVLLTPALSLSEEDQFEKTVSSRTVYDGAIIKVHLHEAELPNGKIRKREVVEHPGGVVVAAILSKGKLLLLKQFRYPLGCSLYEFPAGKLDPGEEPLTAIKRELEEETGYIADNWEELTYVYTSPGFCNEKITIFRATGLHLSPNPRREEDEFIQVFEVTPEELRKMVRERKVVDAKTLCTIGLIEL